MMMGHAVPVFDPDTNPQMHQGPRGPMPRMQPHDQNGDSYVVPISKPYNNNKRKYSDRDNAGTSFNQTMRENNDENSPEGTSTKYFLLWNYSPAQSSPDLLLDYDWSKSK